MVLKTEGGGVREEKGMLRRNLFWMKCKLLNPETVSQGGVGGDGARLCS